MDKHLRPSRFNSDPSSIDAEKEWKNWYKTFTNFLATLTLQTEPAEVQNMKLNTLTNYVSASVYDYIQEATTYDSAIATLQGIFVKNGQYNIQSS